MAVKNHRRELRLSSNDDDLITEAAGLLGVSVSEFLLDRAVADAEAVVGAHRTVRLQEEAYDRSSLPWMRRPSSSTGLLEQIQKSRTLKHTD